MVDKRHKKIHNMSVERPGGLLQPEEIGTLHPSPDPALSVAYISRLPGLRFLVIVDERNKDGHNEGGGGEKAEKLTKHTGRVVRWV